MVSIYQIESIQLAKKLIRMTKATCYYEILGVAETATGDDIKKAYRNLALVWHPDKNQDNPDEAHVKFQSILKAYETLSDSRERDWYDRHKDQILTGGDKTDTDSTCLNLFQYFSSSCYANFDDQEDGFYTVYRRVFETLAQEEKQHSPKSNDKNSKKQHSDMKADEYPTFGTSTSDYDEVVRPFYAFWSNFYTKMTFDHLDTYNTTQAENRRILRAMEKENKKVKDAAKKERNANIRNLVEFIKKRDKRLKAHKLLVEQQNELNRNKTAIKQKQQRKNCLQTSAQYKPTAWEDMDEIEEQLRKLEEEYDSSPSISARSQNHSSKVENDNACEESERREDGDPERIDDEVEEVEEEEEEEEPDLFCPACNKEFRSVKTFENHEASKKHKQKVIELTKLLKEEENSLNA